MAEYINRDYAAQAIEAYLCSQCDWRKNSIKCKNCSHLSGAEILSTVSTANMEYKKYKIYGQIKQYIDTLGLDPQVYEDIIQAIAKVLDI